MLVTVSSFSLVSEALLFHARSPSLTAERLSAATSPRRDLILVWNNDFPKSLGFSSGSNGDASLSTVAPLILARYCVFSSPALRAGSGSEFFCSWANVKMSKNCRGWKKQRHCFYHLFAVNASLHCHPVKLVYFLALRALFALNPNESYNAQTHAGTAQAKLPFSFSGHFWAEAGAAAAISMMFSQLS